MLGRAQKYLFFLIVFFISSQVGLHFWPDFSYVNGLRVDYLSPTLYLLDILIVGWIGLCLLRVVRGELRVSLRVGQTTGLLVLLLILDLMWNVFFAKSVGAHLFGLVKLLEFGVFGLLVARSFKPDWIPGFVRALSLSALLSSTLAIWQFLIKSSVGGIWYFFGERTFSISTVGISTVNLDQQILRPYAAFPHPNILAFFLILSVVFSALLVKYEKNWWRILLSISITISIAAIILSFSRTAILLLVSFAIYEIYTKVSPKWKSAGLGFFQIVIPFFVIFILDKYSQFIIRGIDFREELFLQSWQIFIKNPYYGIGINNFFVNQAPLIHTLSPTNFQPPHNIFVVVILSLGLFGWWIFPRIFYKGGLRVVKILRVDKGEVRNFYIGVLIVLIGIIFMGMFDHFFVTLEQGQIILALILGLAFSNMLLPKTLAVRKSKGGKKKSGGRN